MIWVNEPEVIRIEREPVDIRLIERKSNSKTFKGYLTGCLAKAVKDRNKELEILFTELINKFKEFYPEKIIKVVILQGYKDYEKANPNIWKGIDNNVLIEVWHKKNYETKEIKKKAINRFIGILQKFPIGEEITCYKIAKELGYGMTEKEAWKNLWANRMNEYFPNYYFVCLFLQKIGLIDYKKEGHIIRKI